MSVDPPLIVVDSEPLLAGAAAMLVAAGWDVRRTLDPPHEPWLLGASGLAFAVKASTRAEVAAVLEVAARGAAVVVWGEGVDHRVALVEDLARIGAVRMWDDEVAPRPARLTEDELRLLTQLGRGLSVSSAADELFLSRRTAHRRLASACSTLGVATSAAALLAVGAQLGALAPRRD